MLYCKRKPDCKERRHPMSFSLSGVLLSVEGNGSR